MAEHFSCKEDVVGSNPTPGSKSLVVEVPDPANEVSFMLRLERAGCLLRVREPDHWMLRTPAHDAHLHVRRDDGEVRRHLLFRDWLRVSRDDQVAYETLQRRLAEREWEDMDYYARAQRTSSARSRRGAEAWAARTRWERAD